MRQTSLAGLIAGFLFLVGATSPAHAATPSPSVGIDSVGRVANTGINTVIDARARFNNIPGAVGRKYKDLKLVVSTASLRTQALNLLKIQKGHLGLYAAVIAAGWVYDELTGEYNIAEPSQYTGAGYIHDHPAAETKTGTYRLYRGVNGDVRYTTTDAIERSQEILHGQSSARDVCGAYWSDETLFRVKYISNGSCSGLDTWQLQEDATTGNDISTLTAPTETTRAATEEDLTPYITDEALHHSIHHGANYGYSVPLEASQPYQLPVSAQTQLQEALQRTLYEADPANYAAPITEPEVIGNVTADDIAAEKAGKIEFPEDYAREETLAQIKENTATLADTGETLPPWEPPTLPEEPEVTWGFDAEFQGFWDWAKGLFPFSFLLSPLTAFGGTTPPPLPDFSMTVAGNTQTLSLQPVAEVFTWIRAANGILLLFGFYLIGLSIARRFI